MHGKRRIWRWVRLFLRWSAVVVSVVFLETTAGTLALIFPIWWTAAWMSGLARGVRRGKRDAALAGTQSPYSRKLPGPVFVPVAILAFFWLFGWAIVVGLACGLMAGLAALFLELVTAKSTLVVMDLVMDYYDVCTDFTLSHVDEIGTDKLSAAARLWALANRPLPRNVQVIALLALGAICLVIVATQIQWPWWLVLVIALMWTRQCLIAVRKSHKASGQALQ